jgi:hypothetical protein
LYRSPRGASSTDLLAVGNPANQLYRTDAGPHGILVEKGRCLPFIKVELIIKLTF